MPERIARLASLVVAGMLAAGCSTLPSNDPDRADVTAHEPDLLDALCRTQAAGSSLEAARTSFEAAHRPLHEVAAELADVDRGLAGRLHVTKQATEAALQTDDADLVAERVRELTEVTRQGLVALGRATSECSGRA